MLAAHWKTVILQFNTSKHKVVMQLVLLCFNGEANNTMVHVTQVTQLVISCAILYDAVV